MVRLVGIDLETLGMAPPMAVIETGWVHMEVSEEEIDIGTSGSRLYGIPEGQTMSPENRAVHHIDPASLVGLPLFDEVNWTTTQADYMFAHNAEFERQWFPSLGIPWVCTYKVALRLLPQAKSHSNQALKYELGVADAPEHHPPHRAEPDCIVTALVLERLIEVAQSSQEHCSQRSDILRTFADWTLEPRMLPTCPIGKFRNRPWSEVEGGFLLWMLRQPDMEADLKWCADRELTLRRSS